MPRAAGLFLAACSAVLCRETLGAIGGQSLILELQLPLLKGFSLLQPAGDTHVGQSPASSGRLKLPPGSQPAAPGPLHGSTAEQMMLGLVGSCPPPALTQPGGTALFLQPSEERVSITSLCCNFHRHPHGSRYCIS